jgi:hypothetical protein
MATQTQCSALTHRIYLDTVGRQHTLLLLYDAAPKCRTSVLQWLCICNFLTTQKDEAIRAWAKYHERPESEFHERDCIYSDCKEDSDDSDSASESGTPRDANGDRICPEYILKVEEFNYRHRNCSHCSVDTCPKCDGREEEQDMGLTDDNCICEEGDRHYAESIATEARYNDTYGNDTEEQVNARLDDLRLNPDAEEYAGETEMVKLHSSSFNNLL